MQDPLAELAGYFCRGTKAPDRELVRLAATARADAAAITSGNWPAGSSRPDSPSVIQPSGTGSAAGRLAPVRSAPLRSAQVREMGWMSSC